MLTEDEYKRMVEMGLLPPSCVQVDKYNTVIEHHLMYYERLFNSHFLESAAIELAVIERLVLERRNLMIRERN